MFLMAQVRTHENRNVYPNVSAERYGVRGVNVYSLSKRCKNIQGKKKGAEDKT